jgi:thiopeptide-type bacteriocin biosynthesis protein
LTTAIRRAEQENTIGLLRVAILSVEESVAAVDSGDTSGIEFLEPALALTGEFIAYRDKVTDYDDLIRRYLSRMAGRATPFGVFAGVAPLRVSRHRRLELAPRAEHRVRVRIDVGALESVMEGALGAHPGTVPLLVNPTVRERADHFRFSKGGNANAAIVEIRTTGAIRAVIELCAQRPMSEDRLVEAMGGGAREQRLRDFIRGLVAKELLLPDISLLFHGVEPVELALSTLSTMGSTDCAAALDKLAGRTCRDWSLAEFQTLDLVQPWEEAATQIPALAGIPRQHRYHADLELRAPEATVDDACVSALRVAAAKLLEAFPPEDQLAQFKEAFRARYEDARAPLLEALDPDQGVLPSSRRRSSQLAGAAQVRGTPRDTRLEVCQIALRAYALGSSGDPVDLLLEPTGDQRTTAAKHPPRALHAALVDDLEGRYRALLYASYRHGSLGPVSRFALAREDLIPPRPPEPDDATGPIVAELLFAPGGRYGNIVMRPRLHAESISVSGARSGTIPLDSLDISVTSGNDVVLWHRPSGRQVIPDLNTAHNVLAYGNSPIYTFLARVADWGASMWDWGPFSRLPHLPRVVCGRVIVAQERWLVAREDIDAVLDDPRPASRLRAVLPNFGDRRWLGFGNEDNILVVDTYSDQSVKALLARTFRKPTAFVEMPQVEHPATRSDRGRHVTEVMIPVGVPNRARPAVVPPEFEPEAGREWVYARYHCGPGSLDRIAMRAAHLAARLRSAGAARDWFFVRYDDGVHHVRVRVAPSEPRHRPAVYAALESLGHALVDERLATRTVFDTYLPEPGRYAGYTGLRLAERLFSADSDAVAGVLSAGPGEEQRLDLGVEDALAWSGHIAADVDEQLRLLTYWRDTMGIAPTRKTGKLARERHRTFEMLPELEGAVTEPLDAYLDYLRARPPAQRRHALGSVMHMHFNRLFEVDARRLEWIAYEFAIRAIREWQARRTIRSAS